MVDLDVLEKDEGFCRVLREVETWGMGRRERRVLEERWRVERRRSVPSESVVFRYLERFHDAGEEARREAHRAFIPAPNEGLKGLYKVNADLLSFVQGRSPHREATLGETTLGETTLGETTLGETTLGRPRWGRPRWGRPRWTWTPPWWRRTSRRRCTATRSTKPTSR